MSLLLLALACAPDPELIEDADYDGFPADQDCDDGDALIYPGAPDAPGDGVDADCDGSDPSYAFIGDWEITQLSAVWSGQEAFIGDSGEGGLFIDEDLGAQLDISVDLDPDLIDQELRVDLVLAGAASPVPGEDRSWVWLEGDLYGEQSYAEWECQVKEQDRLACEGIFKVLGVNFEIVLDFTRGQT